MEWSKSGDWVADETLTGWGDDPPSYCLAAQASSLPAEQIVRRNYTMPDKGYATAIALAFATDDSAVNAVQILAEGIAQCRSVLARAGFSAWDPSTVYNVTGPTDGSASFREISYKDADQTETVVESIGLVRAGNRVLFVSMVVQGVEAKWSYEESDSSGLPTHPMIRTLAHAAERLTW